MRLLVPNLFSICAIIYPLERIIKVGKGDHGLAHNLCPLVSHCAARTSRPPVTPRYGNCAALLLRLHGKLC